MSDEEARQAVSLAAWSVFSPAVSVQTPAGVYPLPVIMTALAAPESSYVADARGDSLSIYDDGGAAEAPYACRGYTSFGVWQINLPANHDAVAALSGVPASDPCGQARWLSDVGNCARAAAAIYRSQGLGAWTTWRTGAYLPYLPAALAAAPAGGNATSPQALPLQLAASPADAGPMLAYLALGSLALYLGVSALRQWRR